tara:strand:- start:2781 stop:3116 length:336 start_codon:yes stop_codon:yes gene_type:complete
MNIFKGKEELEEMNKNEVTNFMKDMMCPARNRGGIRTSIEELEVMRNDGPFKLTQHFSYEMTGTNMSDNRPIIDGKGYTWGELKGYPNTLLKVLAYRLWQSQNKTYGSEEE